MDRRENGSHGSENVSNGGQLLIENQRLKSDLVSKKKEWMNGNGAHDELKWIEMQCAGLQPTISSRKNENQRLTKHIQIPLNSDSACHAPVSTLSTSSGGLSFGTGCNSTVWEFGRSKHEKYSSGNCQLIDDGGAYRNIQTNGRREDVAIAPALPWMEINSGRDGLEKQIRVPEGSAPIYRGGRKGFDERAQRERNNEKGFRDNQSNLIPEYNTWYCSYLLYCLLRIYHSSRVEHFAFICSSDWAVSMRVCLQPEHSIKYISRDEAAALLELLGSGSS